MTTKQRLEKYTQEHCKNCKNRKGQDCEIRVFQTEKWHMYKVHCV